MALDAGPDEQVRAGAHLRPPPLPLRLRPSADLAGAAAGPVDVLDIHEEPASLAVAEVLRPGPPRRRAAPPCASTAPRTSTSATRRRSAGSSAARCGAPAAVHTCNDAAGESCAQGLQRPAAEPRASASGPSTSTAGPAAAAPTVDGAAQVAPARLRRSPRPPQGRDRAGRRRRRSRGRPASRSSATAPLRAELDAQVAELGVGDRVELLELRRADELPELYRAFDVLVVPSLDTPGVDRAVRPGRGRGRWRAARRRWCPTRAHCRGRRRRRRGGAPGDVDALADALRSLRDDPAEVARLGRLGPASAARFSWSSIAAQQAELYRTVLRDASGPVAATVGQAS